VSPRSARKRKRVPSCLGVHIPHLNSTRSSHTAQKQLKEVIVLLISRHHALARRYTCVVVGVPDKYLGTGRRRILGA
jgi:hypothetical protein